MTGIELIAAERKRQIEEEGFTAEYDDELKHEELVNAAIFYLKSFFSGDSGTVKLIWPFQNSWWKPTPGNRVRELEKAGALIDAEIDRLLRLEEKNKGGENA